MIDPSVAALLERVDTVVFADGPDGADIVPGLLAAAGRLGAAAVGGRRVVVGWLPGERGWASALDGADALMGGYGVRTAIRDGRATYRPIRLSANPRLLAALPRPLVTVVRGRPAGPGEGGGFVSGPSVGWGIAAAALADAVIVEIDPDAPAVPAPAIPGNVVGTVEGPATRVAPGWGEPDDVDRAIAANVLGVLPAAPTIQYGPGPLLDTIVRHVDRPVGIFSGLATDAVVDLARDGRLRAGAPVVAGYLWGSADLTALAQDGVLRLAPLAETHDVGRLAAIGQLVALNTALQVGLDGAVNVERLGADVVGGVGGHPDFARGASACPDGLSVVVCRSAHRGRSNLVPRPLVTTTARTDVDVVVTEHGTADLRGRSDDERARLLVDIAHPDHRAALSRGDDPNG
ncbi:MAG: acetyl-CoA hydrolase/transferase C-terminal domain-containing protein [Acidimicrobiia bacterium]